jgi:phage tail protein X
MVTSGTSVRSTRCFLSAGRTVRQGAGQGQRLVAEFMRHAVFAHRDFDFHAGVVDLAQHFLDAAHGLAEQRRRLGELTTTTWPDLAVPVAPLGISTSWP